MANLITTTYTVLDLCVDAMIEVGMLGVGDTPDSDAAQWVFRKVNYLLDVWAAKRQYVYAASFQKFTLQAGLSPHTIGPNNATFAQAQRPVRIESWALILNTGPTAVNLPRRPVRDKDWWATQRVPTLQSNIPTDLYYEESSPNGNLFFWPVPNTQYDVQLELWTLLTQFTAITDFIDGPAGVGILPPAYRTALMLTLAETLQPGAGREGNPNLSAMAQAARVAVFGNNSKSPRISTEDSGMTVGRRRADFNYYDGSST